LKAAPQAVLSQESVGSEQVVLVVVKSLFIWSPEISSRF